MTSWEQQGGLLLYLLRRFIDNLFFLWRHGEAELQRFLAHLNSGHPTIKFEVVPECYNFATRAINFLDLQIWIDQEDFIQTTHHQKACRVVTYLLPSSAHPSFICCNIPYSLAFCLVRIESTQESLAKLHKELVSRCYRVASVAAALDRARLLSRATTLLKVPRPAKQPLPSL